MHQQRDEKRSRVIGDRLREWAGTHPDRPFVQCGGPWLTFAQVDEVSDRLAAGLAAVGVERGDRVAVISPTRIEFILLFFAAAKLGVVQVPLNAFLRGEFLRHQLLDSQAATVITDGLGLRSVTPLLGQLPDLRRIIVLDDVDDAALPVPLVPYADLERDDCPPFVEIRPSDLCAILYTAGTTGLPKGCMLSHGYYTAIPGPFLENGWYGSDDVILSALPFFHMGGQGLCLMAGLVEGVPVSFEAEFHAGTFLDRARATGATVLWGVGAMGMALLAQPPSADDRNHTVRRAMWLPMAPAAQDAFEERFGIPVIAEAFGQTECIPVSMNPFLGDRKPGSAGRPCSHVDVRLVDDDDEPVPTGAVGEIVIRPREPNVMFGGYWRNPQATVAASRGLWHHTGDCARFDEAGFLTFVDRKKDALRRRGENIASLEVEAAIAAHPAIQQVAVHAVASELNEDEIKVCIVPASGADLTPDGLFEFFKTTLPYFAVPRYVELMDALPTNALARVMKHVLRDRGVTETTWDFEALGLVVGRDERR